MQLFFLSVLNSNAASALALSFTRFRASPSGLHPADHTYFVRKRVYPLVQSTGKYLHPVLRIREVYPGSDFFPSRIPDPNFPIPDSGSASKNLSFLTPKKWFLSSRKYDPGCSSRIPDPDPYSLSISDPGSWIQGSKRHRIPNPDPQRCLHQTVRPAYFFCISAILY